MQPFINVEVSKKVERVLLDAEVEIKSLIRDNVLNGGINDVKLQIAKVIETHIKNMPSEITNLDYYKSILYGNAVVWQKQFYRAISNLKVITTSLLKVKGFANKFKTSVKIDDMTPIQLYNTMVKVNTQTYRLLGSANVPDYGREVRKRIKYLANSTSADAVVIGQRKTSLIAKVEMDLRYEHQVKMINEKKASGHDLYWISSHSSCSERCEKWQGKLVSISLPSINDKFETGLVEDGHIVYSLEAIINQRDKYGYKNNVIVGFNCRHGLFKHNKGDNPPTMYTDDEIKDDRKINEKLNLFARTIRSYKKEAKLVRPLDKNEAHQLLVKARSLTANYKKYAHDNGVANDEWRLVL
jgi:hypothetical protein